MGHRLLHRVFVEAEGGALVVRCDCECPSLLIWTDERLPADEVSRARDAHYRLLALGGSDFYVEDHANAGPGVDLKRGTYRAAVPEEEKPDA